MTSLLKEAFSKAAELEEGDQEAFARWILDELQNERRWNQLLSSAPDALAALAAEALDEDRDGDTQVLDPARI